MVRGEERTQAALRRRATVIVDGEEVERVRGGEQVGPVARDAARGADLSQPLPVEWNSPDDAFFGDEPRCLSTREDTSKQALSARPILPGKAKKTPRECG